MPSEHEPRKRAPREPARHRAHLPPLATGAALPDDALELLAQTLRLPAIPADSQEQLDQLPLAVAKFASRHSNVRTGRESSPRVTAPGAAPSPGSGTRSQQLHVLSDAQHVIGKAAVPARSSRIQLAGCPASAISGTPGSPIAA